MGRDVVEIEAGARNVLGEAAGTRVGLLPLSVEQYERMIDAGILVEDTAIELLDGLLVRKDRGDPGGDPMTVGGVHSFVVERLVRVGRRLDEQSVHLRTQQPVIIPGEGEPEPDAAIVMLPFERLGGRKPRAEEVSCVIEVAGTSLQRDRTTKLRHYARGGIRQYVLLVLADRTAEEYLAPDPEAGTYAPPVIHRGSATLGLHLDRVGEERLAVSLVELFG